MANRRTNHSNHSGTQTRDADNEEQDIPPQSDNVNVGQGMLDEAVHQATRALGDRIANLQIPREAMTLGQTMFGALVDSQDAIRRAFKKEPGLTGAGLGSLVAGGVLLGLAMFRSGSAPGGTSRAIKPVSRGN